LSLGAGFEKTINASDEIKFKAQVVENSCLLLRDQGAQLANARSEIERGLASLNAQSISVLSTKSTLSKVDCSVDFNPCKEKRFGPNKTNGLEDVANALGSFVGLGRLFSGKPLEYTVINSDCMARVSNSYDSCLARRNEDQARLDSQHQQTTKELAAQINRSKEEYDAKLKLLSQQDAVLTARQENCRKLTNASTKAPTTGATSMPISPPSMSVYKDEL
jgi:hypothetical protein